MSAFLGPIHYWLNNKIVIEDRMTEAVLKLNDEKEYVKGLRQNTDASCDVIEKRPLEEMIDESNIHGWLQHKVNIVERRFAYAVTKLIDADATALEEIKKALYELGAQLYAENGETFESAEQIYQKLNDMLLDCMPCDHVNELVSAPSDEVIYRRTICIHGTYWTQIDGNADNYYELRSQFIAGFLNDTSFSYTADENGSYHIKLK